MLNNVVKYYEYMILGDYFNLASVSENVILTILKATQVSKAGELNNLCGHFLKDSAKFFIQTLISDLCNLSFNSENLPDSCKVVKLKPFYKKGFLTQPCNYRSISLLPLIFKVIESRSKIHNQASTF